MDNSRQNGLRQNHRTWLGSYQSQMVQAQIVTGNEVAQNRTHLKEKEVAQNRTNHTRLAGWHSQSQMVPAQVVKGKELRSTDCT